MCDWGGEPKKRRKFKGYGPVASASIGFTSRRMSEILSAHARACVHAREYERKGVLTRKGAPGGQKVRRRNGGTERRRDGMTV